MKLNEAKLGTPVIFWSVEKGTNERSTPFCAVIAGKPHTLDYGHITGPLVVKITDHDLPISLTQLDLITPDVVRQVNRLGFDVSEILGRLEITDLQRRQINWLIKYEFSDEQFKQMPAMPTDELDERQLKANQPQSQANQSDCKKITVTLSHKATKFFNEVMYSLEGKNGDSCTQSEAINEILETNADFESVEDQSVSGWLRDYHNFYKAANLTPAELEKINNYLRLKQTTK